MRLASGRNPGAILGSTQPIGGVAAMTQPLRVLFVFLACLGACAPLGVPLDGGKPDPADDGGAPPDGSLPACPAVAIAGLHVVVTNASSGARLCDASVTATQGSYSEVLTAVGTDVETCAFQGVFSTGGAFEVRATRPGFEPAEATATVEADGCGPVRTKEVTLPLIPRKPPGPGPDGGAVPLDGGQDAG